MPALLVASQQLILPPQPTSPHPSAHERMIARNRAAIARELAREQENEEKIKSASAKARVAMALGSLSEGRNPATELGEDSEIARANAWEGQAGGATEADRPISVLSDRESPVTVQRGHVSFKSMLLPRM